MNKKHLTVISVVLTFVFVVQPVHGLVKPNLDKWAEQSVKWREKFKDEVNLPSGVGDRTTAIKERREKVCQNAQGRVNERWSKYYARRTDRLENMGKGIKVLENRIQFYKDKGLNVSKLEADLIALKALVDEYKTEYMKFLDFLEGAKTLPCANHEGEFLPKLKEAKDQWIVVKQKADAIRDYYNDTVKPHLQELRAQLLSTEKKVNETEEK